MLKKIAIGLGVVIVVIAVGVYYLSQNAGKIVESVVETQGSRVTNVEVALDAVDISLTDLKAGLRGLTVANPAGFKTDRAISLGEISVKMSDEWGPKLVVIDEVLIDAPEITYEIGAGGSNIAKIQENVDNFMKAVSGPQSGSSGESASTSSGGEGSSGPKVIINDLYIKNGRVNVSASLMQGRTLSTPLPEIHLEDIGKGDDGKGATPAEVVDQLISAIASKAGNAASSVDLSKLGLSDISGKAAEAGKKAREMMEGAGSDAKKSLEGAGSGAKDAVEGLGDSVKGLFGQ